MSESSTAHVAGIYEHPTREAPDRSAAQLHAEIAEGVLEDAGLERDAVDAYFTAGAPGGLEGLSMADYLGLDELSYVDTTDIGGSSYVAHVGHAVAAIRAGKAEVALCTLAGRPRSRAQNTGTGTGGAGRGPASSFEGIFGPTIVGMYGTAARRHMHEFGTTEAQLAEIRVAASRHARHNEHAMFREPVTVEEVLESRPISDPLKLLDCCVISDGGAGVLVVSPDVAAGLGRECPPILGHGEAPKHGRGGRVDLTHTAARWSGPRAFAEAGLDPADVDYASIYDSFTITVLEQLEDLGFCAKGEGGAFVEGGTLQAPHGELPFNTDGGGLCSNHPANRGGMTKVTEAVRQVRGEAHEEVQVPDCEVVLAHGTGGMLGARTGSATILLGREGAA